MFSKIKKKKGGGLQGAFCELRVAEEPLEQECFAWRCFVAWSGSGLALPALTMLLCFVRTREVQFPFAGFSAFIWVVFTQPERAAPARCHTGVFWGDPKRF